MAAMQDRQRRWRKQLALVGLLAAAGAFSLWFRAVNGHFPWSAERHREQENVRPRADFPPPDEEPALSPRVTDLPPASRPAADQPTVSPTMTQPATDRPATRPATPTTLPAYKHSLPPNPAQAAADLNAGLEALQKEDPVQARRLLGRAYQTGLPSTDVPLAIDKLAEAAKLTLFSPRPYKNDPLCEYVVVQPGDTLAKIAGRYTVSEDLLAAVNNIRDKNIVRLGQRLKVMRGPWHAVVRKSTHTMDVYLQDQYVRTFRVGLGVADSTPTGLWKTANHQEDPAWTDPRTGHRWHPSDPGNPIGEYWIGLEGVEGDALGQYGFGIHGTIELDSIGKDVSMGCIRLAPDDIALLYKLLVPGQSFVAITD